MKKYPKPLFGFLDPISICVCVCVCVCVEVEGGTFPHHHQAILRTPMSVILFNSIPTH